MKIKPAPGLVIRDPVRMDLLPEEGRDFDDNDLHWHRMLRDGDVVLVEPVLAAQAAPQKPQLPKPADE